MEPVLLLGRGASLNLDLRIRVKGGGHVSQMYAVRQAIAKAIVAYYQKFVDEQSKKELKDALLTYDRTLSSRIPAAWSPRSSAVAAPARASRSRTVDYVRVRIGTVWIGGVLLSERLVVFGDVVIEGTIRVAMPFSSRRVCFPFFVMRLPSIRK